MRNVGIVAVALLLSSCGGDGTTAEVIEPETFIATWVDLRTIATGAGGGLLTPSERTRVLQQHGVTEEELMGFVDAHGDDPRFMLEVWSEVESRMRPAPQTDTTSPPTG